MIRSVGWLGFALPLVTTSAAAGADRHCEAEDVMPIKERGWFWNSYRLDLVDFKDCSTVSLLLAGVFDDREADAFAKALGESQTLIGLKVIVKSREGAKVVAGAIQKHQLLKSLSFGVWNDTDVDSLSYPTENLKLHMDEGAALIVDSLQDHPALTSLSVHGGFKTAAALARLLEKNRVLTKLDIGEAFRGVGGLGLCLVGSEGTAVIAKALEKNMGLKELNLVLCNVGDVGVVAMARALEKNEVLARLSMWDLHKTITEVGIAMMAKALEKNRALTWLRLHATRTPDQEFHILVDKAASDRSKLSAVSERADKILKKHAKKHGSADPVYSLLERLGIEGRVWPVLLQNDITDVVTLQDLHKQGELKGIGISLGDLSRLARALDEL